MIDLTPNTINASIDSYAAFFTKPRIRSFCVSLVLLGLSLVFNYYASAYSNRNAGTFVGDMFLDNLPTVDLSGIIVEGAFFAILGGIVLVICKPKYLNFTLKSVAMLVAVRAFFVAVTHLGVYPNTLVFSQDKIDQLYLHLNLQAGFFFSSHTGLPILMALIFWRERYIRLIFLLIAAIFGAAVLLAHVHYSIDVFAAPFMVYSIYKSCVFLFEDDYRLIEGK